MPTGKDQVEYNRGLTRLAESARLTDAEILAMFESIFGPNNNKKYSDGTLAIWRPRFDAATDKALYTVVAWLREKAKTTHRSNGQLTLYSADILADELEAHE